MFYRVVDVLGRRISPPDRPIRRERLELGRVVKVLMEPSEHIHDECGELYPKSTAGASTVMAIEYAKHRPRAGVRTKLGLNEAMSV